MNMNVNDENGKVFVEQFKIGNEREMVKRVSVYIYVWVCVCGSQCECITKTQEIYLLMKEVRVRCFLMPFNAKRCVQIHW